MRIAILVPYFPPISVGGTEIATYNIASFMAKRGHDVHVITPRDKGLPTESLENGFHIHRIDCGKSSVSGALSFCIKSLSVVKRINPDIIHSQSIMRTGLSSLLIKKLNKTPYVVYCRGGDVYDEWLFKDAITNLVFSNADALIALTEDMKKKMCETVPRQVAVIPNGVEVSRFNSLAPADAITRLNLNGLKPIIFVGRLHEEKGVKYLIEAMQHVRNKCPDAILMIVGDGPERDTLKELTSSLGLDGCIRYCGNIANKDVPLYLRASDIFVLPSLSEGFPVTVLEAMAAGLPIISTRITGLPEIVKDSINGFLVRPKDPIALGEKIVTLLEDSSLREKISGNNIERVKDYSWDNVVLKLEEIYANALSSHK